jgi:cytochrome b pre-mRNA-processing protein 3
MIFQMFRRGPARRTIEAVYGAIVAQARRPEFYRDFAVPDTVEGRFEMIVLHVALFFRRVRGERADIRALGQGVFDWFCRDLDHQLREMGVGDLAVPRRMKGFGEAFYGRARSYDRALARDDPARLVDALARNVFAARDEAPAGAHRLAAYVAAAERHLAAQESTAFGGAALDFPDPLAISEAAGEAAGQPMAGRQLRADP